MDVPTHVHDCAWANVCVCVCGYVCRFSACTHIHAHKKYDIQNTWDLTMNHTAQIHMQWDQYAPACVGTYTPAFIHTCTHAQPHTNVSMLTHPHANKCTLQTRTCMRPYELISAHTYVNMCLAPCTQCMHECMSILTCVHMDIRTWACTLPCA
jgi:hypothetical protein